MQYANKNLLEVEQLIKNDNKEKELNLTMMAQLQGVKGSQFGKDVYSSVVLFKDLVKFLTVFGEVQRDLNKRKVISIKNYILSGLELMQQGKECMRFFPGITCTSRGFIYYDENSKKIAIDPQNSQLSVNDGQHRYMATQAAIEQLKNEAEKSKDQGEKAALYNMLNQLENMVIPVTIFSNLSAAEERQLFTDTNNLASRPSRSATIRLSQRDIMAKLAKEVAAENKYLLHYGVEYDKMSVHLNNPNTFLLTTIYASLKELFRDEIMHNRNRITEDNLNFYKKQANDTLNELFLHLPGDLNVKSKYIFNRNYTLRAICRFINQARVNHNVADKDIFKAIEQVDWTLNYDYWKKFNGFKTRSGTLVFGGGTSGDTGLHSVYEAIMETEAMKSLRLL